MIKISQIKIDCFLEQEEHIPKKILGKLHIKREELLDYQILRRSIDARDKNQIFYVYEVALDIKNKEGILKHNKDSNITSFKLNNYNYNLEPKNKDIKPIIVGLGPAGLFAAYVFVLNGIKPLIIERGEDIDSRIKTIEKFWKTNILNENSNVQFGEGGAGTFSDGKLNTLTKDKEGRGRFVLKTFVQFGADPDILISNTPHIGTDVLRRVIKNMRHFLEENGAIIRFNTCLTNINYQDNQITSININNHEAINTNKLILAIGHSARDTFRMLHEKNVFMEAKPFAVGLRIQHPQELINKSQYGTKYKDHLGAANYKLTHTSSNGHGVYSFCMCPGGYVVNASSTKNHLAINGMSNYKRDSKNANSALVVTVGSSTYGNTLFAGLEFQEELERKAYNLGEGNIPLQLLKDYFNNQKSTALGTVVPEIKGCYTFANLNELLPKELSDALKEGISCFANKIEDFDYPDAILTGIESRTSSPIKIPRDELGNANIKGIYPCGEGAGYAGGIMTSAIDGMKIAETIIKNS